MPQRALEGILAISRRYTSGAKSACEVDFHPDVTRRENREGPQRLLRSMASGVVSGKSLGKVGGIVVPHREHFGWGISDLIFR